MFIDKRISYQLAINANKLMLEIAFLKEKTIFVSDKKIWQNCKKYFPENFLENFSDILFFKNSKADQKNLKKLLSKTKNIKFIIALGSGVINDLCKLTAAKKNIPYAIFASAASMNGYLSKNASIAINGHKKTIVATLPKAVFCDLEILTNAPAELTKAGIGDIMCFYSCWFDWYLSHKILGTKFDKKPFQTLKPRMDFLLKNFTKFSLSDESFLKILIEILLLSGEGMTMAKGSYPASQSEHLIAHVIEMKYPKIAAKILHGQAIAITTLSSIKLQKKILNLNFKKIEKVITMSSGLESKALIVSKIGKFFGKKVTIQCEKEFKEKTLITLKSLKNGILSAKNWEETKKNLSKIYLEEDRLKKIFSHFKIKTSSKSLGLLFQQYQDCITHAKFIRNRFTCLDLLK
jgi:glycerol-1-phosphate dehydrogenase [NAD(P)+]